MLIDGCSSLFMFAKNANSLLSGNCDFSLTFHNRLVLFHHILVKYMPLERCITSMDYSKSSESPIDEDSVSNILTFLTFPFLTLPVLALKLPYQNVNEICFYFFNPFIAFQLETWNS